MIVVGVSSRINTKIVEGVGSLSWGLRVLRDRTGFLR